MKFIGQKTIMSQLEVLLPELYNGSTGSNILIRGPSGWGKTRMALLICNYLSGVEFQFTIGNKASFNPEYRIHLIDEAHLIENPETLYPIMDSKNFVFVLTTNDVAVLPEALVNRCYDFSFESYTQDELRLITQSNLWDKMSLDCIDLLISSGDNNPRIIISIAERLNLYQKRNGVIVDVKVLENVLETYLGIINGLDATCRRYIEILKSNDGKAGLETLAVLLHINKDSLRYNIEPILLDKHLIQITSKGRVLV